MLLAHSSVKHYVQQKKRFSLAMYIIHRLWRMIPVYAFVVAFIFLYNLMGSGPIYHETTNQYIQACYENWWTNFLFINNFYRADNMCLPHSWYISCDMQLYIAALVFVLPLIRWPKVAIFIGFLGVIISMAYSAVYTIIQNYPPTMLLANPDKQQSMDYAIDFYFKPFIHAGPYCVGLLAGYLLAVKPDLKLPKVVQFFGWCCAIACNMSVLYGVWGWNKGEDYTFAETVLYSGFNRVAWTLGVAWMIVCCITGHGGVINYILSWKVFIPLGRLTFLCFLIHPLVQMAIISNMKVGMQPQQFNAVWLYFGHVCTTYGTAFAGCMLVEAPFLGLEKIFFSRDVKHKEQNILNNQDYNIKSNLDSVKNVETVKIISIPDNTSRINEAGLDNKAFVYKL